MSPLWTWFIVYFGMSFAVSLATPVCNCGKYKPFIVWRAHSRTPYFVFMLFLSICTLIMFATVLWDGWDDVLVWVAICALDAYRIWFHEKDKIKKAAKALGSVRINQHGKLVVVNNA